MNGQPTPLQLSGQQRALYEALSEQDTKLAGMYLVHFQDTFWGITEHM